MKTGIVPISLEEYVELHLKNNPNASMEEIMLKLSEFCHNHHPSRVKILAKFI
jgi:hypothetical protein